MAEFAQSRQTPRVPARAHRRRQHHSLDEQEWEHTLDNTGNRWALEAIGYRGRRHQNGTNLFVKSILALVQTGDSIQELPIYTRDPYLGIREIRYENRFADRLGPGLLPTPPRAQTPSRPKTVEVEMDDPGVEMGDLANQQQATGMRRRNRGGEDAADDPADTAAMDSEDSEFLQGPIKIKTLKRPDPDAAVWDEINTSLQPLFDVLDKDQSCLLLCFGKSSFCRISPVSLGNDKSSVEQWNALRKTAYAYRGRWSWPHWLGKPRLELVEIRALAPHPSKPQDLCGLYQVVNLERKIESMKKAASDFGSVVYNPGNDVVARCWYNPDIWGVEHSEYCFGSPGSEDAYGCDHYDHDKCYYCGIEQQLERLEETAKLEAAPLWSAALDNPPLAAGNSLFPSKMHMSSSEILEDLLNARRSGHVRGLAQLRFTGFRVVWPEEEPGFIFAMACCGSVLLSCLGILGARMAYGDWGTAYTAGAFYVALGGTMLAWIGRSVVLSMSKSKTE